MIDLYTVSQRIILHEGIRLKPYYCTKGKQTIGVGRCLDTNPLTTEEEKVVGDWRHGITKGAAIYLLHNDINRVIKDCDRAFGFFKDLDDERQYALIDMVFQMGVGGVKTFKNMIAALAAGNYKTAAVECLDSAYAKQTPVRAQRIAKLIETGRFEL